MKRVAQLLIGLALTMVAGAWHPASAQGVRVMLVDETENRPVADRAEIWVRGHGSWWLKPALREGGSWTAETLRTVRVGIRDTAMLYIDGRDGGEIPIPFMVTTSMCPNGCGRYTIVITITDDAVEVFGEPVSEAKYVRAHRPDQSW
jgi:hypothetical protein